MSKPLHFDYNVCGVVVLATLASAKIWLFRSVIYCGYKIMQQLCVVNSFKRKILGKKEKHNYMLLSDWFAAKKPRF